VTVNNDTGNGDGGLVAQFQAHRPHLRAVAYRMLGSLADADDAVQDCWVRLQRADTGAIVDLQAWLTTVIGRICLDLLRARRFRREDYVGTWLPEPLVAPDDGGDPAQQLALADSVGLALLVVLETLTPAERLAFVLHDVFAVPFDDVAAVLGRSPAAARKLASRARRRVRLQAPTPDADLAIQHRTSRRSLPPPVPATSSSCWPSSTRTSCSAPTSAAPAHRPARPWSVPAPWPQWSPPAARTSRGSDGPRSSTAVPAWSSPRPVGRSASSGSPSSLAASRPST
jgi:RNA polymerase sigma factor (sigma-70 family)